MITTIAAFLSVVVACVLLAVLLLADQPRPIVHRPEVPPAMPANVSATLTRSRRATESIDVAIRRQLANDLARHVERQTLPFLSPAPSPAFDPFPVTWSTAPVIETAHAHVHHHAAPAGSDP